jgi:CARDB
MCASAIAGSVGTAQTTIRRAAPPTFTVQHVIEAADLQASPQGVTPGQAVTFRFKLKNTGTTAATSIPWVLEVDGAVIGNGPAPGLKPGDSWESTKVWTATAGSHTVRFVVDPTGTGGASGAAVTARSKQLGYAVGSLPATEVRLIDWDAARSAGMTSAHGLVNPTTCQGVLLPVGSAAYKSNLSNVSFAGYVGWVHIMLQCPLVTGGRMSPVVYDNLVLRNGWRVKDVKVVELSRYGTADWRFVSAPPATGSDRPRSAFSVWANTGGAIEVVLRVDIEGPRGTNPYR